MTTQNLCFFFYEQAVQDVPTLQVPGMHVVLHLLLPLTWNLILQNL